MDFVDGEVSDGPPAFTRFIDAGRGEGDVHPAGKETGSVPHRLAVAHQDEVGHGRSSCEGTGGRRMKVALDYKTEVEERMIEGKSPHTKSIVSFMTLLFAYF